MNFIYISHHFTELNKLTLLPMCGFTAQLVEHRTGIAEVTGSNPVEALIFSGFFLPIALKKNCCDDHSSLSIMIIIITIIIVIITANHFQSSYSVPVH